MHHRNWPARQTDAFLLPTSGRSEWQNEIGGEGHLVIALAGVEGLGAVERGIIADLGADDEALDCLRDLRLVVDAEGEGTISGAAAADSGGGKAALGVDIVLAPGDGGDEGPAIVAPDLAAPDERELVAQLVDGVLRTAIADRMQPVVANVVQIGGQGEGI